VCLMGAISMFMQLVFEAVLDIPMNPGKKNPLCSRWTSFASSQPCLVLSGSKSCTSRSMKAILPASSTPIAALLHMSSLSGDAQCTNAPQ
jgi:hypothetical protein